MKILFLSQIVPYPPDAGPRVKTWNVLRYLLSRGHQVSLACYIRKEEERYLPVLKQQFTRVYAVPMRRSRLADLGYGLRSLITGRPFLVERDDLGEMRSLVKGLIESGQVDVVHADQLSMAQFALTRGGKRISNSEPKLLFDEHNAVWTIVERMQQHMPALARPLIALEAWRMKRYEGSTMRAYDLTTAVTEIDRRALLQAGAVVGAQNLPIRVIPITVDTSQIMPVEQQTGSSNIVTLGTLHYPPNADGIRWFLREVFPQVQKQSSEARLTIIGKNPPADFLQLAGQSGGTVTVTGYVPDLAPYLKQAAMIVIPVRAGGGMRVRILEAFAWGIPVVTTTVGLEGIEAVAGRDVLVADQPEEFAACVVKLLNDPVLRASLAENSRRLVEQTYDWQVALTKLDVVYESLGHLNPTAELEERVVEQII